MFIRGARHLGFDLFRRVPAVLAVVLLAMPGRAFPLCRCGSECCGSKPAEESPACAHCCQTAEPDHDGSDSPSEDSRRGGCGSQCMSPCCTMMTMVRIDADFELNADLATEALIPPHSQPETVTLDGIWHPPRI